MLETDLAWAAGIIDGEGSIFIMKQGRKDRERDRNYILRVSVQSTDPYMTKELLRLFKDGAVFTQELDKRPNNSNTLKWQISGHRAAKVLEKLLPYLRVKHEQAVAAIEFQNTTKKHWKHMTEEDYNKQVFFYEYLRQAKKDLKIGKNYIGEK